MNYNAAIRTACAVVLTAGLCWGGFGLNHHLIVALDNWNASAPNLGPTLARVNVALDQVSHSCAPGPCGLIPAATKAVTKSGDMIVTTQLVEQASAANVNKMMDALATIPQHVNLTADAGTSAFAAVSVDMTALQPSIKATTPLLLNAGDAVSDLDALLKDKAVHSTLDNVQAMTNSGAGILANGKTVSDKITYDYTHPVPWYAQPWKLVTLGVDAALLAK